MKKVLLFAMTDLAGNTTKQSFEIEKAATTIAATPIAVTEKPRYGTLELAGHVGGDFIFTKK